MDLEINRNSMLELMKDFYRLTKIRIVLFDSEYHELLSYPTGSCRFCQCMKADPKTQLLCTRSDHQSFENSRKQQKLIIYHCHAGLIEACAPLIAEQEVIGYLMFGQISDSPDEKILNLHLTNYAKTRLLIEDCDADWTGDIPIQSSEQIQAAARIMEACTFYVILKENVRLRRKNFTANMRAFLLEHLDEDLSVARITKEFGISKSKLYQVCNQYLGMGIAEYVCGLRMEKARRLLCETGLPLADIAEQCGYHDYNYFCRVFKKEHGMPAGKYREDKIKSTGKFPVPVL